MSDVVRVPVDLGNHSYDVLIGAGVRRMLPSLVARLSPSRVALITVRPIRQPPPLGVETKVIEAGEGEGEDAVNGGEPLPSFRWVRAPPRGSGGVVRWGSVSDTVGLAASLYHRGLPVIHLPTSLLAQVDASVGGKTAVNLPEGKNLVGSYWQPAAVLYDTHFLCTLPEREWLSGYGEIARCHFIRAGDLRGLPVESQIEASVRIKASVVARDERDGGLRYLLNYGHTLGHALEIAGDFSLRHVEGVAINTVFAGELAGRLGRVPRARVAEHRAMVSAYGLPCDLPEGADPDRLLLMSRDKKSSGKGLTFVLDGPSGLDLVSEVPVDEVIRRAEGHGTSAFMKGERM